MRNVVGKIKQKMGAEKEWRKEGAETEESRKLTGEAGVGEDKEGEELVYKKKYGRRAKKLKNLFIFTKLEIVR